MDCVCVEWLRPVPSFDEMEAGLAAYQACRGGPRQFIMRACSPGKLAWNPSY
jgi:hypothetical protein